jgi:hypothetical protein
MAGFHVPFVTVGIAAVVLRLVAGEAEHVETSALGTLRRASPTSVIRREQEQPSKSAQVQFGADGETIALRHVQSHSFKGKADNKAKCPNFCNKNYVEGVLAEGQPYCDASKKLKLIDDPDECKEAAMEFCPDGSCLSKEPTWEIHEDDFWGKNENPKRCFFTKDESKWWYNPVGNEPTNVSCTECVPICEKPEYDFNNVTKTCAEGYETISDEDTCRLASRCLDFCDEEQFRVLANSSEENTAPKGCHVDSTGCVKFNGIQGEPSGVIVGHPICNLTVHRGSEFIMNAHGPAEGE